MEGASMLRPSTITVATIAACGVTLALGGSFAVQPRFVHALTGVAPSARAIPAPAHGSRLIPHKFMRAPPSAL
jgi:hypothetical protein